MAPEAGKRLQGTAVILFAAAYLWVGSPVDPGAGPLIGRVFEGTGWLYSYRPARVAFWLITTMAFSPALVLAALLVGDLARRLVPQPNR